MKLIVYFEILATPTEFVRPLTNLRVNEEDTVNFVCELNKPDIRVKWFYDGQPLPIGSYISEINVRAIRSQLWFLFQTTVSKSKHKVHSTV